MCLSTYLQVVYLFFYDNRALPQTPIEWVENQPTPTFGKEPTKRADTLASALKIHFYILYYFLSAIAACAAASLAIGTLNGEQLT